MTMMQGLPLTGVSTSAKDRKRGEVWYWNCLFQVKSMHKLLASIYDGLENEDVYDEEFYEEIEIKSGSTAKHTKIFADNCYKLVNLMSEPTNGPVEFPLVHIITVLTRCLKVSYEDVLAVPSRTDLVNILPKLHQSCMDVLSQLILCCEGNILFQSHVILDLCLQTIISSGKMPSKDQWVTKSSAYQALVLWIQTCGWGSYLTSHSKFLIQELIADTQADAEEGMAKMSQTDESKSKCVDFGKKNKGERKKKRKGDSYMELEMKVEDALTEKICKLQLDLLFWAFSLSELVVENLPFAKAQSLISHLVTTSSTVQRLSLHTTKPYNQMKAREGLYRAVTSCLLSSLDYGSNRNYALSHYQLTNSALNILARACQTETIQIQNVCYKALDILRSSECLKGPVIRKVLDFDDTELEDVSQLMREKDQLADNNEEMRQRLMSSEMENEQQSRLISSLKEQLACLQSKVSSGNIQTASNGAGNFDSSQQDDSMSDDEDENDDSIEESGVLSNPGDKTGVSENRTLRSSMSGNNGVAEDETMAMGDTIPSVSKLPARDGPAISAKNSTRKIRSQEARKAKEQTNEAKISPKQVSSPQKCTNAKAKLPKIDAKESKAECPNKSSEEQGDRVEDMLMDFVDAPPDS